MQERIKENNRDIWLARTQTSKNFRTRQQDGHFLIWDKVKFIDREPHRYTRRVKEAIHTRLHPNNINTDNGIKIPEARTPTIRNQHSNW